MNGSRPLTAGYGAIATAVLALLCYALALRNGFAFDDVVLIPNDTRVTEGRLLELITTPYWQDVALALYRPLTSLSFGVDWFVAQGSAVWFHFTNVLWHMLASVLAYALLLRYFSAIAALAGAAIFAAHPVHVEAVANVVGRGELIATTLVLAACVLWPRIARRAARVVITSLLYFLALCAKENAAVLPALLVMIDFADGEWSRSTLVPYLRRRAPELLALVAVFVCFMILRTTVIGGLAPTQIDPALEVINSTWHRILTALQTWPIVAGLFVFPRTLLADYGPRVLMPIGEWNSLAVLGATILLALLGGGLLALARGHRRWGLGLLWYPIAILPVSNFLIPIGVLLAERTLYLPSVAFSFAVAGAFAWTQQRPDLQRAGRLAIIAMVIAFSVRTIVRIPDWKSTDDILLALVRDRPDAFRGQWHVARMTRSRGNVDWALQAYDRAIQLWPSRQGLVAEAAMYANLKGRHDYSRRLATYGAQRWPENENMVRIAVANAIDAGDTASARQLLRRALDVHPEDRLLNDMWRALTEPNVP